ncbi:MAG: HAMP domain-containing histidine kinase [Clostridia bacterium]|nr:HAMP domain-containing histidine kinase [Clostridia bacterium]
MKNSFLVKCIAIILFAVTMTTLLLSGACIFFGIGSEAFVSSAKQQAESRTRFLESFLYNYEWRISDGYEDYITYDIEHECSYSSFTPNFSENILYEIKDENGKVFYSTIDDSAGELSVSFGRSFSVLKEEYRNKDDIIKETYEEEETSVQTVIENTTASDTTDGGIYEPEIVPNTSKYYDDKSYTVTICYKADPIEKDFIYYMGKFYDFVAENESKFYSIAAVSSVLSLFLFIILLRSAGHTKKSENIYVSKFDKFPVDILTAIYGGLTFLLGIGYYALYETMDDWWYYDSFFYEILPLLIVLCIIGVFIDFALLAILLMTMSVRFKTSTFIKSTIIYKLIILICKFLKIIWKYFVRIIKGLWKAYKKINKRIWKLLRKIPAVWKIVVFTAIVLLIDLTALAVWESVIFLISFILCSVLCVGIVVTSILFIDIKNATEDIANGNVYNKINTKHLFLDLKDHAENINNISDGIQKAVAEQMKSERFKTELITNVSHDIKTPLTSIINYVDLLEKEEINNETAKEYIDVLSRQSTRLKKLIDDLLEASKASTGNINVNLMKFELGILLSQALGEYEERFEKNNLQVILNKTDETLFVMADNRHMWRVFDNVLNNIAKYAQSGTRVYVDAKRNGQFAEISFRNISKDPLNISGDELMERFVRGDSSRNTEGSGLGLSIAKSLTEVQKGNLAIQIDGDLFKVLLKFPLSE